MTELRFEEVYAELKEMAWRRLSGQGPNTLQPTVLVHETYVKMGDGSGSCQDRSHFLKVASAAMRTIAPAL